MNKYTLEMAIADVLAETGMTDCQLLVEKIAIRIRDRVIIPALGITGKGSAE